MPNSDFKELGKAIKKAARANAAAAKANEALDTLCEDLWGFAPGDRDVDAILDSVYGLAGEANEIPLEEFVKYMNEA